MQLFGSSGIRTLVDRHLLQLSFQVGLVVGSLYGKVIVGRDTRTSGEAMKHALIAGLLAGGCSCCDAGVLPTPTLALAGRRFDATAMVTASHNPPEYNGIKLLNPDGSAFDSRQRQQIEKMVTDETLSTVDWNHFQNSNVYDGAIAQHIERIVNDFPSGFKLKVVLDCGCGAASVITPYLLRRLGCEIISLNSYPSGFFPHNIEPVEANLGELIKVTKELGADLGLAHDGDADRVMAVDDKGRFISGDQLLALFASNMGARQVVTTVDASMVIEDMGFAVTRTKVGDIYVSDGLKKGGLFGGEPSGAWVFPQVSLCPDGIYAAAKILDIASRHKLSQLVDQIPQYPIRRGSISTKGLAFSSLEQQLLKMEPLSIFNVDGTKLNFKDGWVLVRASGTEPKVRITVEAKSETRMQNLYDEVTKIIKSCVEG